MYYIFQPLQLISLVLLVVISNNRGSSAPTKESETTQIINTKYPLTDPILLSNGSVKYRIAIISDLDAYSKLEAYKWHSFYKKGTLTIDDTNNIVDIDWDSSKDLEFKSGFSSNGRGLELSELVTYNGNLLTVDDKTGLVYRIEENLLIPWVIIMEKDGHSDTGKYHIS